VSLYLCVGFAFPTFPTFPTFPSLLSFVCCETLTLGICLRYKLLHAARDFLKAALQLPRNLDLGDLSAAVGWRPCQNPFSKLLELQNPDLGDLSASTAA
jgi:hypothetical protein